MRIGICDDEPIQVEAIKFACDEYFANSSLIYEYKIFSSGEELLKYEGELIHLLFLDIEMDRIDGISVMKKLEKYNNICIWRIVFVSSHEEAVWSSFGIKTLGFERKPISSERLSRYIRIALRECENNQTIVFDKFETSSYIKLESLLYLEAEGNYVRVFTDDSDFLVSGNLKKWGMKLNNTTMIRVHKSFLVNMQNIKRIDERIELYGCNLKIPIGRKYKKDITNRYNNFLMKKLKVRIE